MRYWIRDMGLILFYKKHERHINTIAFASGYVIDNITMVRVDVWYDHVLLVAHLSIAAIAIILLSGYERIRDKSLSITNTAAKVVVWLPVIIQFGLGSIFSGSLVFYSRSASLSSSWPFVLLLAIFLVGNERIYNRYTRLTFQIAGLFVASFLYFSFTIPILMRSVGILPFLLAGLTSLLLVFLVSQGIRRFSPEQFTHSARKIFWSVLAFYVFFNALYLTNLIPPLPLSLKELNVYHSIVKTPEGDYDATIEPVAWFDVEDRLWPLFHAVPGESIFVYSSIFAPARIDADIVHEWFYFDEAKGKWVSVGVVRFPISGGRDGGYRGYSQKNNVSPGRWRVEVKTVGGQKIGRVSFTVRAVETPPAVKAVKL